MPVRVELSVTPSRWRWWLLALISLLVATVLVFVFQQRWLVVIAPLVGWLGAWHMLAQVDVRRLLFEAETLVVWDVDNQRHSYEWQGEGRRSSFFVYFQLLSQQEANERLDLIIWRDSVSDSSWRALNMAYLVASHSLRQSADDASSQPFDSSD